MIEQIRKIINDKDLKSWQIFVALVMVNIIIAVLINNRIMTKEAYYSLYSEKMELYQIDSYYWLQRSNHIWGYVLMPAVIYLKVIIIALLFQFMFLVRLKDITFKNVYRIALFGFAVLTFGNIVRVFWLMNIPSDQINQRILSIMPFSLANIVDTSTKDLVSLGIISSFNIFEVIWFIVVSYGLKIISESKDNFAYTAAAGVWMATFFFSAGLGLYLSRVFNVQ